MPEENKERLQDRCDKTVGYLSRSYKLMKDVGEGFPGACDAVGVSLVSQLTKMMMAFT